MTEWPAMLFTGEGSVNRQHVQVRVEPDGLAWAMGENQFQVNYEGMSVRWSGPETNQLIVCQGEQTLYLDGKSELLALLLQKTYGALRQELEQIQQHAQAQPKGLSWIKLVIAGVLGLSLLGVGGWYGFFWLRDEAVKRIPPSWEVSWGETALQTSLHDLPLSQERILTQAVEHIGASLVKALPQRDYPFKFYVAKNKEANAFALPGGPMVVFTGLIAKAPSPEALAGVMAHEIQHVQHRHGLKRMLGSIGASVLLPMLLGDTGNVTATLGGLGAELTLLKFDRTQESEADQDGLKLMQQAGIPPQGMLDFFQWLAQKEANSSVPSALGFLSTHPAPEERLQALQQMIQQLEPLSAKKSLVTNWEQIQALATKETP